MKKLLLIILTTVLVMTGAGLVQVKIKGDKNFNNGPISIVLANVVSIVESNLPWAKNIKLKIDKVKTPHGDRDFDDDYEDELDRDREGYRNESEKNKRDHDDDDDRSGNDREKKAKAARVYMDRQSQINEKYAGLKHVVLTGKITGNGQSLAIIIDIDYNRFVINAITVIGPKGEIYVLKQVDISPANQSVTIATRVQSAGPVNLVNNFTMWANNTFVGRNVTTKTGDMTSQQIYASQGAGFTNATAISDNFIKQTSTLTIANPNWNIPAGRFWWNRGSTGFSSSTPPADPTNWYTAPGSTP